jgi:hypothetical protein
MMRLVNLPRALSGARGHALETLRAVGASALLTMRLFELLPDAETQPSAAIVRELTLSGRFDPREVLPNGVVLTLPLAAADPNRQDRLVEIGPN